jgi:PAS domain-containing protein
MNLLAATAFDQIHPEDTPEARRKFEEVLQRPGKSLAIDTRVRHKDGSWRWVESRVTNLLDNPAVGAVVSNFRDITERKRVEQQLKDQQKFWRVALTSIGDGVILTDAQGRVTFLNAAAAALCGWQAEEATSKPLREIFDIVNE